jgi:cell wall-associated NlpC family hydrolase
LRVKHLILPGIAALALSAAPAAFADGSGGGTSTTPTTPTTPTPTGPTSGGAGVTAPPPAPSTPAHPTVSGYVAQIVHGVAYAPSMAPIQVKRAIWAGNKIRHKPYIWGGGHAAFKAAGYDCSGSVSYVLHAAGLLKRPDDSTDFESWGQRGIGEWITVYTNAGHAFIEIAGIRFDTSSEGDPHPPKGTGPRWRPLWRDPQGFMARHPLGF